MLYFIIKYYICIIKIIIMKLLFKEVAKRKNIELGKVAEKIGISYPSLFKRMNNNPKFSSIQEIANAIGCEIHELIETSEGYAHFYDDKTGEWLGIRKK